MPRHASNDKPATLLQTVERALTFLELLAESAEPLRLRDVAGKLGINVTTGYHLLNTLMHRGYVTRKADGTLVIGAKVGLLHQGLMSQFSQGIELREVVEDLTRSTGETCYLTGLSSQGIVIQIVIEATQAVAVRGLRVGYSGAEHVRASAKAVLAHLPSDQRERVLRQAIAYSGDRDEEKWLAILEQEFVEILRGGWALDNEQFDSGVCCVAAPYFGADGHVLGSIALSAPASRFALSAAELTDAVTSAARQISGLLGYQGRDDEGSQESP